jgi:hypothetical protein
MSDHGTRTQLGDYVIKHPELVTEFFATGLPPAEMGAWTAARLGLVLDDEGYVVGGSYTPPPGGAEPAESQGAAEPQHAAEPEESNHDIRNGLLALAFLGSLVGAGYYGVTRYVIPHWHQILTDLEIAGGIVVLCVAAYFGKSSNSHTTDDADERPRTSQNRTKSISYEVRYTAGGGSSWQTQGGYLSMNQAISNARSQLERLEKRGFPNCAVRVVEMVNRQESSTVWSG